MARVWGVGLLVAVLAACGGNGGSGGAVTSTSRASATVAVTTAPTSTVPPTTAAPMPTPEFSFDGSVPPPPLVNTGTDYAAIFESLYGYLHWLYAHNPDPNLLGEVVAEGTTEYQGHREQLELLRKHELRFVRTDFTYKVEVTNSRSSSVTLVVTDNTSGFRLIKPGGSVHDEARFNPPTYDDVLMVSDGTGRWRIANVETRASEEQVTQL